MATETEEGKAATVSVVLLQPLRGLLGASWAAGERAGFSRETAEDLIQRGIARKDTAERTPKAPAGPPTDKMIGSGATIKK